jgi:23S rRNA (adenine2503-C2)-methyltransferase
MHEVPANLRHFLKHRFTIGETPVSELALAADGTRKLLLRLGDGAEIESVIIPNGERTTLCISSQAGCAMACEFCATARMGLRRNLSAAEILGQIIAARRELKHAQLSDNHHRDTERASSSRRAEALTLPKAAKLGQHGPSLNAPEAEPAPSAAQERLTNYVFMGMGEPLANYGRLARALTIMTAEWALALSPRRITVSTVGLVPMMERLMAEFPVNLAVSLHAASDELRNRLAPINRRYPLAQLLECCRRLPLSSRSRITFEYVMLRGINDSAEDARRLLRLLAPLKAKVNLIFFNQFPGAPFQSSARLQVEGFQAILHEGNLTATIRESRGQDIAAACGQLYAEKRQQNP